MISPLKVFCWGGTQPRPATEASAQGECVCVPVLHLLHLVKYISYISSNKKKKDCHFVHRKAWGTMLKTPVGDLSVCNVFWPSELFISASVTSELSLSRRCLPSGALLTDTNSPPLPITHAYLDFLGVRQLSGYLLGEAEEKSLLQRLSCYFLQSAPHRREEHWIFHAPH